MWGKLADWPRLSHTTLHGDQPAGPVYTRCRGKYTPGRIDDASRAGHVCNRARRLGVPHTPKSIIVLVMESGSPQKRRKPAKN